MISEQVEVINPDELAQQNHEIVSHLRELLGQISFLRIEREELHTSRK